jgi:hypothetical protein
MPFFSKVNFPPADKYIQHKEESTTKGGEEDIKKEAADSKSVA